MTHKPLIIISAPSGAGKGTLIQGLLKRDSRLVVAVSATTREPRIGEIHGEHYYFMSIEQFQNHITAGDFLEWEEVYPGVMYGTLCSELERLWAEEKIVLLELDVNGALALKEKYDKKVHSIFLLPPSLNELKKRLIHRGAETDKEMNIRMERAEYEMSHQGEFDARVVNQDLDKAIYEVAEIIDSFVYGLSQ